MVTPEVQNTQNKAAFIVYNGTRVPKTHEQTRQLYSEMFFFMFLTTTFSSQNTIIMSGTLNKHERTCVSYQKEFWVQCEVKSK